MDLVGGLHQHVVDQVIGPVIVHVVLFHHDLPLLVDVLLGQVEVHDRVGVTPQRLVQVLPG